MSYIGNKDYNLQVLRGLVAGHTMVQMAGHNSTHSTTKVTVTPNVTTKEIDQSAIMATPVTVSVASTDADDTSAGAGARTVLLTGLDSSGDVQTETITLNGQTAVASTGVYSAINGIQATSWGATTYNEGDIWCGTGTFTAGVPATGYFAMEMQTNVAATAHYVVPNGKTFYLRQLIALTASTNKSINVFVEQSSNGVNWLTLANLGFESGANPQFNPIASPGIPAGWAIRISAESTTTATDISVFLAGEMIDD